MRLALESVTIDKRSATFPEKWTAREDGTAIWAAPWFDVKYRIQAPPEIGAAGAEIRIDAEISPKPGQSGTAYVKFLDSSHIVREPLDREMFVPIERGMPNRATGDEGMEVKTLRRRRPGCVDRASDRTRRRSPLPIPLSH
jgi:hypothetical protein